MKMSIKNFGPIHEAKDICISPLTLFVGPSNTGKSYLTVLVCSAVEAISSNTEFHRSLRKFPNIKEADVGFVSEELHAKWLECMRQEWENNILYYLGEEGKRAVTSQGMSVVLSSDDGNVVVNLNKSKSSKIKKPLDLTKHIANLLFDAERAEKAGRIGRIEGVERVKIRMGERMKSLRWFQNIRRIQFEFAHALWRERFLNFYLLPAVRGGIMQSYRAITSTALEQLSVLRGRKGSPMISGVLGEFAQKLIDIPEKEYGDKKIKDINKVLESNVLRGKVHVKFSKVGLPEFRYAMKGKKDDMAINNVSASVAELAALSVFMRYYLSERDLLVLEEPETNLHPERQQDVADIMVRLANAGVFVLLTTHSDIVLGQIGNAYRASQLKDAGKGRRLLGDHEPLDTSKELAVYSFVESPKGTKVKEMDFGHMTGAMTKDHLDAARSLYNQTVRLVNSKNNEKVNNDGKKTIRSKV